MRLSISWSEFDIQWFFSTIEEKKQPLFDIPSVREYFVDLDYVLGVISDGPTKSFAFKRLKYLASKFTMYSLLNEPQEVAEMKVCFPFSNFDSTNAFLTSMLSQSVPHRYVIRSPRKQTKLTGIVRLIETFIICAKSTPTSITPVV